MDPSTLRPLLSTLFVFALTAELLIASQFQPYARAADRQALTSLRPSTAHLLAERQLALTPNLPSTPLRGPSASPGGRGERVLALSSLFFDPGDKTEQEMIYGSQLNADEVYDRIIASKHKEILSPNLPLYYRLPGVDGYDGGLLPTRRYAEFVKQFAHTPSGTVDGRLREFLQDVPANRWIEQMAVRYVIADKTQDAFVDGVYYDLMFGEPISETLTVPLTPYTSTALGLVMSASDAQVGEAVATAQVTFDDGSAQSFDIRATAPVTPYFSAQLDWGERRTPTAIAIRTLRASGSLIALRGLTSIDATDGSFLSQMVIGDHAMRLAHSGDVKIYENLRPAPRAFVREIGDFRLETEDVSPERVKISLNAPISKPTTLILRDTCYPGWVARVDRVETPIECADVMFRSVALPAGARSVEFNYEPRSVHIGAALSLIGLCALLVLIAAMVWANKKGDLKAARSDP